MVWCAGEDKSRSPTFIARTRFGDYLFTWLNFLLKTTRDGEDDLMGGRVVSVI